MQDENNTPAPAGMPLVLTPMKGVDGAFHADDFGFMPAVMEEEAGVYFNTATKQYEVANAATASPELLAEAKRLNEQQLVPGVTAADLAGNLPDYVQNPSEELQAAMAEREATLFAAKDLVPEVDLDEVDTEGKAYVQQIGDTNFYVQTDAAGYKQIVLPRGLAPKIDASVIGQIRAAQEEINPINEANGFPAVAVEQVLLSMTAQAMRQRQQQARFAPDLGQNHPFAVANRVRTKHPGVAPNSRAFRQLVKKEMGFKRFGNKK